MKADFSKAWTASKQPRKQRKYRYNSPLHLKHRFLNSHLSGELRKKYGKRSAALRKGDEVLVMRGAFKKKKAKVSVVDLKKGRVSLENINKTKKDGTKVNVYFNPSSLMLQSLSLDDKKRIKSLGKKSAEGGQEIKEKKDAPKKN
ncbi:50S ribosomal protein L24 [Candidatus Pacearchaeota archaeon CG_4_9_14_0_2_um_filter_39_13]|nr:50S ribosomal protein L24 [Candidatus Pacearchaeota archaeon]OIO44291.1 MAG: 50S ribosomal protein L24 [Candidatus Pacearchaeota archaeon CG1_02_39_14]PJC44353.1 MAG: 50S ribosomal protein L24 [Candidatus Pacearchaeota archaeon CG_4_9_14_0_2_um_filter_39_13]